MAATGVWLPQGAGPAGCTPHFLFPLVEKKTGRARSKRKDRLDALRRVRASALYGGRREMVPACLRGPADRRGGVRYRLDGGFPRRGCVLGWGAKPHLTSSSFRAFRFATRYLGGCGSLCWRADEGVRPYTELEAFVTLARADTQVGPYKMHKADGISVGADAFIGPLHRLPRGTASRSEKRSNSMRQPPRPPPHHPPRDGSIDLTEGPSVPEGQEKSEQALVRRPPYARRATAPERVKAVFSFGPCTARFLFGQDRKENGGCIPLDKPPVGAGHPPAAGQKTHYRRIKSNSSGTAPPPRAEWAHFQLYFPQFYI